METLPDYFRNSLLELGITSLITFNDLKRYLRIHGLGFDIRYIFDSYRSFISDTYGNYVTKHETFDGATKHTLSTILSKLKNILKQ